MNGIPTYDAKASFIAEVGHGVPRDNIYGGGCGSAAPMGEEG